jgi:hypothetical protein
LSWLPGPQQAVLLPVHTASFLRSTFNGLTNGDPGTFLLTAASLAPQTRIGAKVLEKAAGLAGGLRRFFGSASGGGFRRFFGSRGGGVPPDINWGAQEKHFVGHNSFVPGRSELTADPRQLVTQAGSGQPIGSVPRGQPGFKERVDFGEDIGFYVDPETGVGVPTTNGIIHYSSRGVHIVPSRP